MNRSLDPPSSSPPSSPPSQSLPSDYTVHTLSPLPHTHGRLDAAAFLRECFQPWAGRRRQEEGDNVQILTVVIKKNTKKKILKKSQFGWIGGVFARAKKQRKEKNTVRVSLQTWVAAVRHLSLSSSGSVFTVSPSALEMAL